MNIKEKNINNSLHWQRIWFHWSSDTSLVSFSLLVLYKTWSYPTATTFYINGQGASVWCKRIVMNIKEENINHLLHWQRIWFHWSSDTSLVSYIRLVLYKTWPYPTSTTFYINGHGASMWSKCIFMNMKEKNINNFLHWQRIWLHWSSNTSLDLYILLVLYTCTKLGYTLLSRLFI